MKRNPRETAPKTKRPDPERQEAARTAEEQGEGKKKAKAKKKADAEKLGWGIGFKELIARAGIDVNDAQQMDGAELQL